MARHTPEREPEAYCGGKVRFLSFTAANKAARRSKGRDGAFSAYHCPNCSGFHVGTRTKRSHRRPRARALEELEL